MYGIAVSVAACLRAGTRVDVAWIVDAGSFAGQDPTDALALTPGGGRIGTLLDGAADGVLVDVASRNLSRGRLVDVEVGTVDALVAGLPAGGRVRCLIVPATELPVELWDLLLARQALALVVHLDGDEVTEVDLVTAETAGDPGAADTGPRRVDGDVVERVRAKSSGSVVADDTIVTILSPVSRLVIVGRGPIPDALERAAALLGWRTQVVADQESVTGLLSTLAPMDNVVVASHDLELAGRALSAALSGDAGYIGALGSRRMQESRAEWLAYRGVTELGRIHGPAGLDIGAGSPAEIAVAILAEALAVQSGRTLTSDHA